MMVVWADVCSQTKAVEMENRPWLDTASKWVKLHKLHKPDASVHRDPAEWDVESEKLLRVKHVLIEIHWRADVPVDSCWCLITKITLTQKFTKSTPINLLSKVILRHVFNLTCIYSIYSVCMNTAEANFQIWLNWEQNWAVISLEIHLHWTSKGSCSDVMMTHRQ